MVDNDAADNAATISDESNITVTEADYTAVNELRRQLSIDGPIGKQWFYGRTRCGEGATEGQETAKDAAAVKKLVAKVRGTLTRTQCAAAPCTLCLPRGPCHRTWRRSACACCPASPCLPLWVCGEGCRVSP